MDAADWQIQAESIRSTRLDLKNNVGMFPGAGDSQGKVLRESRAGHLMVPLLPDSSSEFDDTFVPSEAAGPLVFLVKRDAGGLPGSRTIRDLMITSGDGSLQKLHRTFRRFRQIKATESQHDSQVQKRRMESDVVGADGTLHRKPRKVSLQTPSPLIWDGSRTRR